MIRHRLFSKAINNQIFMLDICTFNLGDYIFFRYFNNSFIVISCSTSH